MTGKKDGILIVAGEASGDLHGSMLVRELFQHNDAIEIFGIGGDAMIREGLEPVYHINELSILGFSDVIRKIPLIRSVEKTITALMKVKSPCAVVLIDFPGMNLRIARHAKELGIPVIYYIAPQLWAWGKGRIAKIKKYVDDVLVILPFEEKFYADEGIHAQFVGHPILDHINEVGEREPFCRSHNLDPNRKILALFPGSREKEIRNHLGVMVRAAAKLRDSFDMQPVIGVSQNFSPAFVRNHIPDGYQDIPLLKGVTAALMKHAEIAFVKSGTITLEAACFQTPMVVLYRTSRINYLIARALTKLKYFSLVNIIAGKEVVRELSQKQVAVNNLVAHGSELLMNDSKKEEMIRDLSLVREMLVEPGAAVRVRKHIERYLTNSRAAHTE